MEHNKSLLMEQVSYNVKDFARQLCNLQIETNNGLS